MALYAGRTGMGAARRMTPMAARGFATEKQIALRIAATSNLKKASQNEHGQRAIEEIDRKSEN
jgi:hypothetical protein